MGTRASTKARATAAALVAAAALVVLLGVLPALPSGAGGTRDVCGTLRSSDDRYVRAEVSLVLTPGTTLTQELNPDIATPDGIVPGSPEDTGSFEDTFCFADVGAGATRYALRAVPLDAAGEPTAARHGGASTLQAPLPGAGAEGLELVLPLVCEQGGDTGSITVQAFSNGQPTTIARVRAVGESTSPATGRTGHGHVEVAGAGPLSPVALSGLEPGTRYWVEVVFAGRSRRSTFTGVAVRACQTTTIRAWTGATPAGTPPRWTSRAQTVDGTFLPVPGDFTGDGRTDVLWYAAGSATDHLWVAGAGGTFTSRTIAANGVYRPVAGDFDGDGVDDIFWYGPAAAADRFWFFAEGGQTWQDVPTTAGAQSTTSPRAGDVDGNGVDDVLFWTPNGGDTIWLQQPDRSHTSAAITIGGSSNVEVGDVDGDGRADVLQHDTLTGAARTYVSQPSGGFQVVSESTSRTHIPVMGDLSCDLRADVVMYQPGSGNDVLWRGRGSTVPVFTREPANLAVSGSYLHPFVGDFDGNGCDDVFWYQPGSTRDSLWFNNATGWNRPATTTSGSF